jgi:hypothetical protein
MGAIQRQVHKPARWESYFLGIASIFDFGGSLRRRRPSLKFPSPNDSLHSDWQAIGDDMRRAIHRFTSQHPEAEW